MTIRVLLVDDEPLVRSGLRVLLDNAEGITVVAEVADGAQVANAVARWRPSVVLMDVRMPIMDGIEATRRLKTAPDAPKVVVLTTFENDQHVYEALHAGADGFLLKRAQPDEIAHAVRVVAAGESVLFPHAIRSLVRMHGHPARASIGRLTDREREVLRGMAAGLSNSEIAAQLFLGIETVKTHASAVLAKLGARDRTQAVIAAYESGFITPG
jgi:DNA-binding NarL/FixJ family response regulator